MIEQLKAKIKELAVAYKQIATQKLTEFKSAAPQIANEEAPQSTSAEAPQATSAAAKSIGGSVGKGGANAKADVITVQTLLKGKGYPIAVDGDCGNKTITAIADFQTKKFGKADGRIDPGGKTWTALSASATLVTPPVKPVTPITPVTPSNTDLGIGAEASDYYDSQRDNKMLDLKNSTSKVFKDGKEYGDVQCNITSLAMQLVGLADGDKAKVDGLIENLLKKNKVPATLYGGYGLPERLGLLVDSNNKSIFGSGGLEEIAKALPELVSKVERIELSADMKLVKQVYANKVVPALKEGAEVIISAFFTGDGHIISLLGVRNDGIVANDPYGCNLGRKKYLKNGKVASADYLKAPFLDLLKRRTSLNGQFPAVEAALKSGNVMPANLGAKSFFSWEDYIAVGPKYVVIAYKKR
jgi:peptidoglycan hydrolase-like protein with peptidoglycan-binding domain